MRFYGLALVAGTLVLGACGGGENKADTTAGSTASAVTPPAGATATATPTAAGTPAPITGTTHTVRMVGDDKGFRFEPADITIKAGDGIKWIMVSGGPHNVAFDPSALPAEVKSQLLANMPNQQGELSSNLMMNPNEEYIVSFANVKPGKYDYNCTPHLAMNMKGSITVQ